MRASPSFSKLFYWMVTKLVSHSLRCLSFFQTEPTNLALMGVIPANINGDRLVVQQISCIASKSWLYTYGRFTSYYLLPRPYALVSTSLLDNNTILASYTEPLGSRTNDVIVLQRILAEPGNKERRKLAVMLQALADIELLVDTPNNLEPIKQHFKSLRSKIFLTDYVLVKVTPKTTSEINTLEDMEMLEFLTRNMFVHRSARWVDSLK